MNGLAAFHALGCPLLVGASRKRTIGALHNEAPADSRLGGSVTLAIKAAEQGRPWDNLAYAMHRELDKAYDALNVAPPTYEPGATGHVPEMIELIFERELLICRM